MVHCSECVCKACKTPKASSNAGMHWYLPSDGGKTHWYLTRRETPASLASYTPENAYWPEDTYWPSEDTSGDTSTHWYLTTGQVEGNIKREDTEDAYPGYPQPSAPMEPGPAEPDGPPGPPLVGEPAGPVYGPDPQPPGWGQPVYGPEPRPAWYPDWWWVQT